MKQYLAICATHGRHECLERAVGMFLNNTSYVDKILLIHNNAPFDLIMDREYPNIFLVNRSEHLDGSKYTSLGDIYNDSLAVIEELGIKPDVVSMLDDDDLYLPNHISEGIKGYEEALLLDKLAYKPRYSYFRHSGGVQRMENVLEPSIFLSYEHLKQYGFSNETTAQHLKWLHPLIHENKILVKELGEPTLIYNWGPDVPTFKTSGDPHNPLNFQNYRSFSSSNGDGIITPLSPQQLEVYYKQIDN